MSSFNAIIIAFGVVVLTLNVNYIIKRFFFYLERLLQILIYNILPLAIYGQKLLCTDIVFISIFFFIIIKYIFYMFFKFKIILFSKLIRRSFGQYIAFELL